MEYAPRVLRRAIVCLSILGACREESTKRQASEASGASSATAAAPVEAFDDVPPLPPASVQITKPILPPGLAAALPDKVGMVRRETIVNLGAPLPPTVRAATAAQHFCQGPPFVRFTGSGTAFYGDRLIADTLLDVPRLRALLECGRATAKASQWVTYVAELKMGGTGATVRLFPDAVAAPLAGFTPPVGPSEGLTELRCDPVVDGTCLGWGTGAAKIVRLGLDAVGPLAALQALTATPSLPWVGADATRMTLPEDTLANHDVSMFSGDTYGAGFFEMAIAPSGEPEAVERARGSLMDVLRQTEAFIVDATPSGYWGSEIFTVRVARDEDAPDVQRAIDHLIEQLVRYPAPRVDTPTPDAVTEDVVRRAIRSSLATAKVTTKEREVEVRVNLALDPTQERQFQGLMQSRADGLAALERVLRAVLAGSSPAASDLERLGGPGLVDALASRRGRAARVSEAESTPRVPNLPIPRGGLHNPEFPVVRYDRAGADLVDDALDLLRSNGFAVRAARLWTSGPSFFAAKGRERYYLSFVKRPNETAVDLVITGP